MKISGFTYACNADSLYYPVRESILSILPVCDELIVALGKGSDGDRTRDLIVSINDPRIRIIDTVWEGVIGDHLFRQQANIALGECRGDWCFHIQCDEVVHENDLPVIRRRCLQLLDDTEVEGFVLNWMHFWGDYDHYQISHRWFKREIRIIRNGLGIESYLDSQSFRRDGQKLSVAQMDATIYHYCGVRPPKVMGQKQSAADRIYKGGSSDAGPLAVPPFDYGSLEKLAVFKGAHPGVMKEWIAKMDWKDQLQYRGKPTFVHHHDKLKYRILTFIEQKFLGGRRLGGFKNYILLKNK